jgi:cytochrome c-type biogenesis protein CcmE
MSDVQPSGTDPVETPRDPSPAPARRRRGVDDADEQNPWVRRGLVLGLTLAAASIVALVLFGVGGGAVYAKPVDELLAQKGRFAGRAVRAQGDLVPGSLQRRIDPCEYTFTLTKNGMTIPVRYAQCVVPDTFKDVPGMNLEVTVEGKLEADNSFTATSVIAKCPSKYEQQEMKERGIVKPHGPMSSAASESDSEQQAAR